MSIRSGSKPTGKAHEVEELLNKFLVDMEKYNMDYNIEVIRADGEKYEAHLIVNLA